MEANSENGFRTPKTLTDEGLWCEANAYIGRPMLIMGLNWVIAAVGLRYVSFIRTNLEGYNAAYGLIVLIGLLAVVVLSIRYLRSL